METRHERENRSIVLEMLSLRSKRDDIQFELAEEQRRHRLCDRRHAETAVAAAKLAAELRGQMDTAQCAAQSQLKSKEIERAKIDALWLSTLETQRKAESSLNESKVGSPIPIIFKLLLKPTLWSFDVTPGAPQGQVDRFCAQLAYERARFEQLTIAAELTQDAPRRTRNRYRPTHVQLKLDPDTQRVMLWNAGWIIYGSCSTSDLNYNYFNEVDVEQFYHRERAALAASPIFEYRRAQLASMTGEKPDDAALHLSLAMELHRLEPAWRFLQIILSVLTIEKGVSMRIQHLLNRYAPVLSSVWTRRRYAERQHETWLFRISSAMNADPRNTGGEISDNYQQQRQGSSATAGSSKAERMALVTDFAWWPWHNPPQPGTDPMRLTDGQVAWSPKLVDAILMKVSDLPTEPWMQLLEKEMSCSIGYTPGNSGTSPECGETGQVQVKAQRLKDELLAALKAKDDEFYKTHPNMRRNRGKFGLKGSKFVALGATPFTTKSLSENAKAFLHAHRLRIQARVDADLQPNQADCEKEEEESDGEEQDWRIQRLRCVSENHSMLPGIDSNRPESTTSTNIMIIGDCLFVFSFSYPGRSSLLTNSFAWSSSCRSSVAPCLHSQMTEEVWRSFIMGDHELYPMLKTFVGLARLMDITEFDYIHPLPELWHTVGQVLEKFVLGQGYDDQDGPYSWQKICFFEPYFRRYRSLSDTENVPWGLISCQSHFVDNYRVCLVLHYAWRVVRSSILQNGAALTKVQQLLIIFLDNDLPIAFSFLPGLKLDPETTLDIIRQMARVARRWHVTGYAKDLLQLLHDLEVMPEDRRRLVNENWASLVGVVIEYLHGRLASSQSHHTIATVESINRQHANMANLDRACELLDLIIGRDERTTQTYHLPDINGCDKHIQFMAGVIRELFESALTATATPSLDNKSREIRAYNVRGLCGTATFEIRAEMWLSEASANKASLDKTIANLRKANDLDTHLPHSKLTCRPGELPDIPDNELPSLSQMSKDQLEIVCRRRGIEVNESSKVKDMRRELAVPLRRDFVCRAGSDDGEIGKVIEMMRRFKLGDLSMVGAVGALAKYTPPPDELDPDIDTTFELDPILPDDAPVENAVAPDGYEIVDSPPQNLAVVTFDGSKHKIKREQALRPFLGTPLEPTRIMVWFDATLSSGERSGWHCGTILEPTSSHPYRGLVSKASDLASGYNYRAVFAGANAPSRSVPLKLTPELYSVRPRKGARQPPDRSWVMLRVRS